MSELDAGARETLRQWANARGSGHYRRTCPECSELRSFGRSLECLSATVEDGKVIYKCWHCEKAGAVRLADTQDIPFRATKSPVKLSAVKQQNSGLDQKALTFLKGRGIGAETAALFSIGNGLAYFPDLRRDDHCISFPYYIDKKQVGAKYRATSAKAHVCLPALYCLFGMQLVDMAESKELVICEGEIDALSMREAGVLNATSVPNGASSFTKVENPDDLKAAYAFLWHSKKEIEAADRVVIATDDDEPGHKLAEELARRIGKHRCWRAKYPEGCKDANDVLLRFGGARLAECVALAEPWPIDGLYGAEKYFDDVMELFDNGYGERVRTGFAPVDEIYSVGKGLLTVITGLPANGKSQMVDALMLNLARMYGHSSVVCSFENPPHVHIAKLSEMLLQKHFFETDLPGQKMKREEMEEVLPFIAQHFKFIQHDDGRKMPIEVIIEAVKTAVFRWGVRNFVLDPLNYIARPKSMESETQWIDEVLTQLRLLAVAHDLHVWFVAHPTKLTMDASGHYPPPKGYSISGSASFYSKADFGLTVHKNPEAHGEVKVICWKCRFHWLGKEGEVQLLYDNTRHVYLSDPFGMEAPLGRMA